MQHVVCSSCFSQSGISVYANKGQTFSPKQVDASINWTAELKYAQQLTERGGDDDEEELMFVMEARHDYTLEINNGHCEPHTLRRP